LHPIESLAAGGSHGCATLENGTARCWGANESGQLGTGDTMPSLRPIAVTGLAGTASIAAGLGRRHSCTRHSGGVRCWGSNQQGELGDPSRGSQAPTAGAVVLLQQVTELGLGAEHGCAVITDGSIRCWGANGSGRLGDGTTTSRPTPVRVAGLAAATSVVAGQDHTCALLADGTVRCWGANESGQLGDGTTVDQHTAALRVVGLNDAVVDVSAGGRSACAVIRDGAVLCWGANESGQLGDGSLLSRSLPVRVRNVSAAVGVAVGERHACALLSTPGGRVVRCWGANTRGQLGDGSVTPRFEAGDVSGLQGLTPVEITAGPGHTCVVLDDRTARCWGANDAGQLGDGATDDALGPTPIIRE